MKQEKVAHIYDARVELQREKLASRLQLLLKSNKMNDRFVYAATIVEMDYAFRKSLMAASIGDKESAVESFREAVGKSVIIEAYSRITGNITCHDIATRRLVQVGRKVKDLLLHATEEDAFAI